MEDDIYRGKHIPKGSLVSFLSLFVEAIVSLNVFFFTCDVDIRKYLVSDWRFLFGFLLDDANGNATATIGLSCETRDCTLMLINSSLRGLWKLSMRRPRREGIRTIMLSVLAEGELTVTLWSCAQVIEL